ncbi:Beta-N-acetylhexosaminidase [Pseudopedobacter saltans DSM 12145]|uniref:beta-N-acetylhexosaminidase n=1 Tax=Pseudopedobacter saltans (strain ATCC 51119 / DSM 12145 / JCM 21818 / CCUG 39354 / LMG 10337 / NBRC 100064 / NCIMB 13643) TaxID=762903 RepID=F0S7C0_PSESL|nr:family 20 glycosylhydrolase [Pseudopedobacter saltans]ADY51145.1 Beta-N-acetylhexosaminidase [Pseudopedobacter saltans DSM 12145]
MSKRITKLLLVLIPIAFVTKAQVNNPIIPKPNQIEYGNGYFQLDKETAIIYQNASDLKLAELFRDLVKANQGIDLVIAKAFIQKPKTLIYFNSSSDNTNEEAYTLKVSADEIAISGKERGVFYGLQSLNQLYLANKETGKIPQQTIKDEPRYKYRGLHLDVGRHMFPLDFIKKYIDLMAVYKLNNFHWHLTEDQGWRIEIKKYPKLQEIAAYRDQTVIGNHHANFPRIFDGQRYGGYYTQEEAKEIVTYAASKYINVIPEIELPGHSMAALSAYPELACGNNPGPFKAAQQWGVFPDIYCAGKEQTFRFLEDVLTEVLEIFPSKYIHIGGDEAPKDKWKTCPYCQKRIKENRLKDEHQLQSYFIHRMEKFLNKKGRAIIGWDEILEGGLAPNATVMSWRGEKGGIEAAKQHHDVIMTPSTNGLYIDHIQGRADQEPTTIGGNGFIERIYAYNPTPSVLSADEQKYVIGVQANMWTEYIQTPGWAEYMLLPRLMAVSETAWTQPYNKNYSDFTENRLPFHLAEIDKTNTNYRVPPAIGAKDTAINVNGRYVFNWKPSVKGGQVHYSLDGKDPGYHSRVFKDELEVIVPKGESRQVKSVVIAPFNRKSSVITTTLYNRDPFPAIDSVPNAVKGRLKYYYIPGKFESVMELDTNSATQQGYATQVRVTQVKNRAREYGLIFEGYINVNEDATFEFALSSNDGSKLYIDDQLIIDNDGRIFQYERAGGAPLKAGLHKIKVLYFDNGPSTALQLYVKGTDGKKIELPAVMMSSGN